MGIKKSGVILYQSNDSEGDVESFLKHVKKIIRSFELIDIVRGGPDDIERYIKSFTSGSSKEYQELVLVLSSIEDLGLKMFDLIDFILRIRGGYGVRILSLQDSWLYNITGLPDPQWNSFKGFIEWIKSETVEKRRRRQIEAWNTGKRRGRPPAMSLKTVAYYVKRYKDLAVRNKKALWLIVKAEGHEISYRRFLEKVNKVLDSKRE